ncbi:hypothetical protein [Streptomyces malaysiensis]|uniref:hypothetical protein n=1 Tax=Streptomyces malaysiensis TaxID=92644 RepID=UPI00371A5429
MRPGRAVLVLAALSLIPPTVVLGPRAMASPVTVEEPDAESMASPEGHAATRTERAEQHPDRDGSRPHLVRRSAP